MHCSLDCILQPQKYKNVSDLQQREVDQLKNGCFFAIFEIWIGYKCENLSRDKKMSAHFAQLLTIELL